MIQYDWCSFDFLFLSLKRSSRWQRRGMSIRKSWNVTSRPWFLANATAATYWDKKKKHQLLFQHETPRHAARHARRSVLCSSKPASFVYPFSSSTSTLLSIRVIIQNMQIYYESAGRIGPNRIESLNRAKKLMPIDTNQNTASFKNTRVWYGKSQNTLLEKAFPFRP